MRSRRHRTVSRSLRALPLLFAVWLAPGAGDGAAAEERAAEIAEWYRGPVRYLITRREEKEFRALGNDAQRALFVRDFWRKRDPDPRTPENEARMAFWQRVSEAVGLFSAESGRPGWITDRGRIHILLGPPDDVQEDRNYPVRTEEGETRGLLRWSYHGRVATGQREPTFVVAFVMSASGEWRLSDDAILSSVFFDPLAAAAYQGRHRVATRVQRMIAERASDLAVAMDLARITTPVEEEKGLIDTVTTETFIGRLPIAVRWDFLPGPGDGRSLVLATVFVRRSALAAPPGDEPPRPLILGRLECEGAPRIDLGETAFQPDEGNAATGPDGTLAFQAKLLSAPGSCRGYVGLFDTISYGAGADRGPVEVAPFPADRLSLSPIIPLRRLEKVAREADIGFTGPFIIGELRVVPRARAGFPRDEGLGFYFQIAAPAGRPAGRLELRFLRRDGEGAYHPVGAPVVVDDPDPVQGWLFPIEAWPEGAYRLDVRAAGGPDGAEARRLLDFDVLPPR